MKFLSLFLVFVFLLSCSTSVQEKKNPIEGTWEMISGKYSTPDTTTLFPVSDHERMIKIISKKHFVFVNQDTSRKDYYGFGGGKYTLDGDNYTEHLELFSYPNWIGESVTFTMKVKGDTLIQSGILPIKKWGFGEYDQDLYEVYIRLD
jgi:hypothetical protein